MIYSGINDNAIIKNVYQIVTGKLPERTATRGRSFSRKLTGFTIEHSLVDGVMHYDVGTNAKRISYHQIHTISHYYFVIDVYSRNNKLHIVLRGYDSTEELQQAGKPHPLK